MAVETGTLVVALSPLVLTLVFVIAVLIITIREGDQ
jgi:hypothetical protein